MFFGVFCETTTAKKKPLRALFLKGLPCGSNRTRTYDTPGMKWSIAWAGTLTQQRVNGFAKLSDPRFDPQGAG